MQLLNGKTKPKFCQNISNYYDEMKSRRRNNSFQFEEDPFSKNVQNFSNFYHKVILLLQFLRTKPQIKNMIINYYDLYNSVIKNRKESDIVEEQDIIDVDEGD